MFDVIAYIRSFFAPRFADKNDNNKRKRTPDLFEEFIGPRKQRKLSAYYPEDDWLIAPRSAARDLLMDKKPHRSPVVNLEDDDDPQARTNGVLAKSLISSTPNNYGAMYKSKAKCSASNGSKYYTPRLGTKDFFNLTSAVKKTGIGMSGSSADFSYRLDEKRKYQELLQRSGQGLSAHAESFASYYTPLAKTPLSRGKLLADLSRSPGDLVDLTLGDASRRANRNTSKAGETILKVLEDLDVVVAKDADSDAEELPTPPSPKPDIKVERVNSLRRLAESCEPLKDDWIGNKVRKHRAEIERFASELEARQTKLAEVRRINEEIQREQLEKQIEKCLHIKEVVVPVEAKAALPPLTDKQEQMVDAALARRAPPDAVLASRFNLSITRRDMLTLAGLNWLNDEVINFYMNLLIERGKLARYPSVYAFNTFFYPKILKDGQASVRRWTRRVDVFAQDIVCVPVHLGMHWCMAIVDMRAKTVCYYDSMGKPNAECTSAILRYLQDEHADKKGAAFDARGWQLRSVRDVPQQMNGSDCGMFSCTYAEFRTRGAAFTFSQDDMPYLRRKMVVEILNGQLLIQ